MPPLAGGDSSPGSERVGDWKDDDPTETSGEPRESPGAAPAAGDATEVDPEGQAYTEYRTAAGDTSSTGFDRAAQMARKAQAERGRLLKKRFVLEDVLGEGGMGRVYKARDLRKVEAEDRNPYIAVKVLGQSFQAHPQAFVSLQQEAVKSQKLAHPNIVTVHDFDRDGDTIFMTMELLKGDPLDALLKLEAPFGKEVALRYFRDLCAGLEYAHRRDLVHSDFKPGNIFVTAGGTVKILDFGIARAANRNALTHDFDAGELGALTPAYATVEMVRGEPPSFSDDIYALACVLYVMLTGEHPYGRKSAAEAAEARLRPARPEGLNNREWQALSAALSTDSARRPASVAAFREAMLPPRKAGALKGLAVVALLILGVGGWLGYQQYQARQAQAETVQTRLKAAQDCFFKEDFQCTIENAMVANNLAPDNDEAGRLLEAARREQSQLDRAAAIDGGLAEARECLAAADFGCARVRLREVLELDPEQREARSLLAETTRRSERVRLEEILARAGNCLDSGNLSCVEQALADAEEAGAAPADLYPVQRGLDQQRAEREAAREARAAELDALLDRAETCLEGGDFACSEARLEEALAVEAGNPRAIELKQTIAAARQQRRFNEQTVANFLQAAQGCYERKDYSCTIAKSESALAIIPGYGPARELAERAEQAQKKAKMSISIE